MIKFVDHRARRGGRFAMRRRSKPRQGAGRPNFQRYLFYAALVILSLAFPAALTLVGRHPPPSSEQTDGDGDPGMWTSRGDATVDAEAVSPLIWSGIGKGIPPTPQSAEDIHVVFSTDCSPYQNYQAIMLFNSAEVCTYRSVIFVEQNACVCVHPLAYIRH